MRDSLRHIPPVIVCLIAFLCLDRMLEPALGPGGWVTWLAAALAVAGVVALAPVWTHLSRRWPRQRGADREAEMARRLGEFSHSLSLIADMEPLVHEQLGKLRQVVQAERLVLMVADDDDGPFQTCGQRGFEADSVDDVRFPRHARLVKWLVVNERPLTVAQGAGPIDFLEPETRELLGQLQIDLIVPLTAMNRLVGLLLVGRTQTLEQDDVELLKELGPRLGLALQNVLLLRQSRLRLQHLRRTERLATVGQLAAGAAHEIRNPLTSVRSTIQYLIHDCSDGSERAELLDGLIAEVDRINEIITGLLSFARPRDPVLTELDLSAELPQVARLVENAARSQRVEISLDLPARCLIQGDAAQLKQVFLNLLMNAIQAMPEGGRMRVRTDPHPGGRRVTIEVSDTGCGIPPGDLDHIFDPFFTTRQEGTGLGLAVCHGIVARHGGEMSIESSVGEGTTVKVRL